MDIEEKIDLLDFQLSLLFENRDIDRFIYESKISRDELNAIMDYLDLLRSRLDNGEEISHMEYECEIYNIVPSKNGDYHFCELIAKLFAEEGQWEEVFSALYGSMPKYSGKI